MREDGTWFGDRDIHRVLETGGVTEARGVEAALDEVSAAIVAVRTGRGSTP